MCERCGKVRKSETVAWDYADNLCSLSATRALWPDIVAYILANDHTNALLQIARRTLHVALP